MTLTQQWWCLNLITNSFFILFPAKGVMSYRQIISGRLYVCLKGICSFASRALFQTPVNKPDNVNVIYLAAKERLRGPRV